MGRNNKRREGMSVTWEKRNDREIMGRNYRKKEGNKRVILEEK